MALHNREYHALCDLSREVQEIVKTHLANNETFARIQGYIQLANEHLDKIEQQVKKNNQFYEHCSLKRFYFDKGSLLNSSYEIGLYFTNKYDNGEFTSFGVDTLIILLAECKLLKD